MKNKENDMEKLLLSGASLDELIRMKIEEEFNEQLEKANRVPEIRTVTDIAEVPKDKIFSKDAVYKVFNRNNKSETYINGLQAEALLGVQHAVREKVMRGELSAFTTDDAYVKFEKICVNLFK